MLFSAATIALLAAAGVQAGPSLKLDLSGTSSLGAHPDFSDYLQARPMFATSTTFALPPQ